ncbi:MAG TPA: efflux RND transporter permease subunit, partial [Spirochaetota bacterium]|nr:efflux RND transporter permease subunit [Spirochaetota bacterium]
LFLGSVSSTINILLAIPTSLLGTFIVLYFLGYTLNTFTLLALSLVVGIVVDDSIMVLENITRHREQGKSRIEAAMAGARQITSATFAASLAVIAIFLPVAFMSGIIGKFFLQFGVTVSVAVALSLVEALTLTPMRCSQFLEAGEQSGKVSQAVNRVFAVLSEKYRTILGWTLNHRMVVLGTAVLFFAASLYLLVPIKKEFVPVQDQSMFLLSLKTSVGSSLEYTDEMTKKVERYLAPKKEVLKYYSAVGGFSGGEVNTAMMFVTMKDPENRPVDTALGRPLTQQEFVHSIRKGLNAISRDLRVTIMDLSMRGLTPRKGFPVELIIRGSDWGRLGTLGMKIAGMMKSSGKCVDVDTSYDLGQPELQIIPERGAAELRGVSMASIGETVGVLMGGRKTGKFTEGGHRYDIRLRLKGQDRTTPGDIRRLYVRNNRGELVRLSDVVKVKDTSSLLSITRLNRARSIFITANPAPGYSQQDAVNESLKIAREVLPGGYEAEITGAAKTTRDSFASLIFALVLGIVVAYMVLASQYNSYIHPLTILVALPFSFSGALIALLIFGQTLNMFSFIGLILLMGIVKKNSILLVEFTNQMRKQGLGVRESLLNACPVRLRPIMMTS